MKTFRYDSVEYERTVDLATAGEEGYLVVFFSDGAPHTYTSFTYDSDLSPGFWNSQEDKDKAIMTAALDNALANGYKLLINPRPIRFMCPR